MFKPFLKFALIVMVTMVVTYFLAGLVARFVLGGSEFYPPSPTAISYLRDPAGPGMALVIWPAQALRGLLFALVLFPLRKRFAELGVWGGRFGLRRDHICGGLCGSIRGNDRTFCLVH